MRIQVTSVKVGSIGNFAAMEKRRCLTTGFWQQHSKQARMRELRNLLRIAIAMH